MRATVRDVAQHPSWLPDWWGDLPMRRRWWWSQLLFEDGAGWLRWAPAWRERIRYDPPDFDQWRVFPPLHRAWIALTGVVLHPLFVLRGDVGWLEWPKLVDVRSLRDDERKRLFR